MGQSINTIYPTTIKLFLFPLNSRAARISLHSVSGEPACVSYRVFYLRPGYERSVVLQYLGSDLVELAYVHCTRAYAVCQDAERRDLHCSPTTDAVSLVVRELS
jgi:hypothetical protein